MGAFIDLAGKKFGRLTVVKRTTKSKNNRWLWLCKCSCGTEKEIDGQTLRAGQSSSCGCLNSEQKRFMCFKRNETHGMSHLRVYRVWTDMRNRCSNPNNAKYHIYGARGIKVCPKWDHFDLFLKDMGHPPSPKHSSDRIDPRGPYIKSNCRWAIQKTQQNNRRNNRLITCDGRTQTLQQWAEELGIPRKTISNRIDRGWTVERALNFEPI